MSLPDIDRNAPHVAAHNNERHALNALQNFTDSEFVDNLTGWLTGSQGAVSSTSRSKHLPALGLYFPEAEGALGGTADDALPLAATLGVAANANGSVYLGQHFSTSAQLVAPIGLRKIFSGHRSIGGLKAHSSKPLTTTLLTTPSTMAATSRGLTDCVIENITFDGASLAPQRWLQTSTGVAVTNPEADYYDATTNPTGKINNPAYASAPAAVAASQTIGAPGNLTLTATPVQVNPVRKITITGGVSSNVGVTFTITGTDINGAAISSTGIVGPIAGAVVSTTAVFRTVTAVTVVGGGLTGNVTVGTASFGAAGLVAVGRRNANYTQTASMVKLTICENVTVRGCLFINHYGIGLTEQGGKNVRLEDSYFDNVGKSDGAYMAIWCQSYGNPKLPTSTFWDSENTVIDNCRGTRLERGFALFAPTKGGDIKNCIIDDVHEFGIFHPGNACYNGGRIINDNNTIKKVRISDIVAHGIETNAGAKNINITRAYIEDTDDCAVSTQGGKDYLITNCHFKNVSRTYTTPYGPFSERYSYNVEKAPIAGEVVDVTDGSYMDLGTQAGVGADNVRISNIWFHETRATFPPIFRQVKSGGNNIAKSTFIEDCVYDTPSGMIILDDSIGNIWVNESSLLFVNNTNQLPVKSWTPSVTVGVGDTVQAPDGTWIKSTTSRNTLTVFDATEQTFWLPVSTTIGTIEQLAHQAELDGKQRANAYKSVTANYTVLAADDVISGNATTAAFNITLPTAVGITGRIYTIRKSDTSANKVSVVTSSSQTIGSVASPWVLGQRRQSVTVQSDGANWVVIRSKSNAYIRKTSDTAMVSSTTMTADPEMVNPVQANAVYKIVVVLLYNGAATGDIKYQLLLPTGAIADGYWVGATTSLTAGTQSGSIGVVAGDLTATRSSGASDASTTTGVVMHGLLTTGSTGGSVTLKWAQLVSDPTATNLLAGSYMSLERLDAA